MVSMILGYVAVHQEVIMTASISVEPLEPLPVPDTNEVRTQDKARATAATTTKNIRMYICLFVCFFALHHTIHV